jgi:7 transmembrane sweet-taste receptor of 3 GCPR
MPEINSYCFLRGLLVDLPAATSAAILLARCWRVHVTLCNANTFGRSARTATRSGRQFCRSEPIPFGLYTVDALTFLVKLPGRIGKLFTTIASTNPWKVSSADAAATTTTTTTPSPRSRSLSLRQTATAAETASLSVLLAMPELVLQVLGITLAEPRLELQYDDKAEIGRYTCQSDTRWVQKAGLVWMGVLLVTAVTVAWAGRDLPQAFNEKTAIFNTASICAVILLVSLVFTGITDDPQTAPFVPVRKPRDGFRFIVFL